MTTFSSPVRPAASSSAAGRGASPARRKHIEENLQCQIFKFFSESLVGNSVAFAVPNGGRRGFLEAKRFKAMGVLAGMADIGIINDGRFIGLELKAPGGRISDNQAWCHRKLRGAGARIFVCHSLDEVIAALKETGVPMCVNGRFL